MMDLNKLREQAKARKAEIEARKAGGAGVAKIPAGTSRWRILPGWRADERETYYHDFGQHWIKDAEGNVLAVYVCEWDTYRRPCDFCAPLKEAIRATKDDGILKALKEMTSRRTVLVNAIQTAGAGADPAKVVLLGMPVGVADSYANLLSQRFEDDINLLDLKEGRDLVIEKTGTGLNTRYTVTDAAKSTAVDPALMESLVNIDAWIEAQRTQGLAKGVLPLNNAIAGLLGGRAKPRTASLVGGAGAAALSAPVTEEVAVERAAPRVESKPAAAAPVAGAAASDFDAELGDAELDRLMKELA